MVAKCAKQISIFVETAGNRGNLLVTKAIAIAPSDRQQPPPTLDLCDWGLNPTKSKSPSPSPTTFRAFQFLVSLLTATWITGSEPSSFDHFLTCLLILEVQA